MKVDGINCGKINKHDTFYRFKGRSHTSINFDILLFIVHFKRNICETTSITFGDIHAINDRFHAFIHKEHFLKNNNLIYYYL